MKVISLSALQPQSGKDTLADFIQETEGMAVKRISFGDALRQQVIRLFTGRGGLFNEHELMQMLLSSKKDVSHEAFAIANLPFNDGSGRCVSTYKGTYRSMLAKSAGYCPIEMTKPRSLRFHMQQYGNNFTKEFRNNPDYWIEIVRRSLNDLKEGGRTDLVIVTDTRSPEEFKMLTEEFDAHTFCITRVGFPVTEHEAKREPHPIEDFARHFKYDWELNNVYGDETIMQADFMNIYNNYI